MGERNDLAGSSTTRGGRQRDGTVRGADAGARRDHLAYIADMLAELSAMTSHLDCATLSGLLALARQEAHQEMARK